MDLNIRRVKTSFFNIKSILLVAIVVSSFTGCNLWVNRNSPPLGYGRYSKFGFSFEYPQLMNVIEQGFPESGSEPSDFTGLIQAQSYWENIFQNLLVIWFTEVSEPDLPTVLNDFYTSVEEMNQDTIFNEFGSIVTWHKDGHEMLYQFFELTQSRTHFMGIIGIWYEPWSSLHANRVYILSYITFPESATQQQVLERFYRYLNSFSSQGTGIDVKG